MEGEVGLFSFVSIVVPSLKKGLEEKFVKVFVAFGWVCELGEIARAQRSSRIVRPGPLDLCFEGPFFSLLPFPSSICWYLVCILPHLLHLITRLSPHVAEMWSTPVMQLGLFYLVQRRAGIIFMFGSMMSFILQLCVGYKTTRQNKLPYRSIKLKLATSLFCFYFNFTIYFLWKIFYLNLK